MVTSIHLRRFNLITKDKMESYCKGEERRKDSVNDDLESLFENIRLGKKPNEFVRTYFLPKLTAYELELVKRGDTCYLQSFYSPNPDVDKTEMMLSESDTKYVRGESQRKTFFIDESETDLSDNLFLYDNSSEILNENSFLIPSENYFKILAEEQVGLKNRFLRGVARIVARLYLVYTERDCTFFTLSEDSDKEKEIKKEMEKRRLI